MALIVITMVLVVKASLIKYFFITITLSSIFRIALVNNTTFGKLPILTNTYLDSNCGVSIQYPTNWEALQVASNYKLATSVVNLQPSNDDGSKMEVEISDISNLIDRSFETVTSSERDYIRQYVGKIESYSITRINGYPAQMMVYTEELPGIAASQWSKKIEVSIIAFEREYKLYFDNDNADKFDKYASIFRQMITTFKIYEPKFEGINCEPTSPGSKTSVVNNSSTGIQQVLGSDYTMYENAVHHISAAYPKDWTYQETGHDEIFPDRIFNVNFYSPPASDQSIQASMSFSIEKLKPSKTTLEEYKDRIVSNLKGSGSDIKDIVVSKDMLGTDPAYRISNMVWLLDHWEKSISVYAVNGGKLREADALIHPESVEYYSQVIDNIIKSVKFQ
jgi:hypothetical protein